MPVPGQRMPAGQPTKLAAAAIVAAALLVVALLIDKDHVPGWEADLIRWVNGAPDWVAAVLWPVMQFGSLWGPVVAGAAAVLVGVPRALAVLGAGVLAWFAAKGVKEIVERGRPPRYIADIDLRGGTSEGLGFVSGHTAVAFALAATLIPALPRWARVAVVAIAAVVGVARMVYGAHLPLDVVGGALLGIICGVLADLIMSAVSSRRVAA